MQSSVRLNELGLKAGQSKEWIHSLGIKQGSVIPETRKEWNYLKSDFERKVFATWTQIHQWGGGKKKKKKKVLVVGQDPN